MRKRHEKYYIGDRFRQVREMIKLTQTEMAGKLGITQQTYSRIESGGIQPQLEHIITVIKKFTVNPNYLLLGEGKLEKTPDKCPYLVVNQAKGAQEYACVIREIIDNKNIAEALGLLYGLKDAAQEEILKIIREKVIVQKLLSEQE